MATKVQYKTKQRDELVSYLQTIPGEHFTASDIFNHFHAQGKSIGTTTVYRQLERMVEEGLVNKYIIDENSSACFEYIDRTMHCHHPACYHCKCEKCGKLIHMDCQEIGELQAHLMGEHGFRIDLMRTVFYGICEECMHGQQA